MPRVRELGVWLEGEHVADLVSPRVGRIDVVYRQPAFARYPLGTPVLSCSLPLRRGQLRAKPFADGLLPEGQHRLRMAEMAGVPTHDVLGMLARFGRDVAGALVIAADAPEERPLPSLIGFTQTQLEEAVRGLDVHPLALFDDSELSIAGLQDKMLLARDASGSWARPVHGFPSTHILKVNDRSHPGLVLAEHACLTLARAVGIAAADSTFVRLAGLDCIIVQRFDREVTGTGDVRRVHQEDLCQALGVDADAARGRGKYEKGGGPSFRSIATLLDGVAQEAEAELLGLVDRLTFTVAIGDADAHGKNVSLLHPRVGDVRLAPMYDTVPTMLWPELRADAAMAIAGRFDLRAITRDDLLREVRSWGLSSAVASARLLDVLGRLDAALEAGVIDIDTPALAHTWSRVRRLLAE